MPAINALTDLGLAVTQLTFVPLRIRWPDEGRPGVAAWYGWVGLLLGLALMLVTWLSALVVSPVVSALAGVLTVSGCSRLLHWDGLADVGDAWFAPADRRLDIMRDSHIGAFGVFAVVFGVVSYVALLGEVISASPAPIWGLVGVVGFARLSATFAAWFGKPARADGLAAGVAGRPTAFGALVTLAATLAIGAIVVLPGGQPLWLPVAGLACALVVPHLVSLRFGGVTGDVIGASVIVTELLVLLLMVVAATSGTTGG